MIADCVRSHRAWIRAQADTEGGASGAVGGIEWVQVPSAGTVHLLFPDDPQRAEVQEAVAVADGLGAQVGLWSAADRSLPWLRDLGFRAGWQPWWMQADPARVRAAPSARVRLTRDASDTASASLARRPDVLVATAVEVGQPAGGALLHLDGTIAGLFDMAVQPRFQRRGLGRELIGLLAAESVARGVTRITLNATPVGAVLYAACGFRMLGAGRTWWRSAT